MDEEFEKALDRWIRSVETKLTTLNERTKMHTYDLNELKKEWKKLKKE